VNVKIAPARVADADILAELARTLIEHGLPHTWTQQRILRQIYHPECAVITARDGRRLAGFAIMRFLDEHAHLDLLAVRGAYRQRGVGRALVAWLETCARTAGIFEVRLELRATNRGAHTFYAHLGFRECGVRRAYYSGLEDAIRMLHDLRRMPAASR
jgi:ribosomal-protein-alanine N-acetyltransferase